MADLTIYEKTGCSACVELIELLDERGVSYDRIEYHETGLTAHQVRHLLDQAGIGPREALRVTEPLASELGLESEEVTSSQLVEHMAEHPELLQRPFVVRHDRAVLARPVERVLELLET